MLQSWVVATEFRFASHEKMSQSLSMEGCQLLGTEYNLSQTGLLQSPISIPSIRMALSV